jgi:hypothetical protein
MDISMVKYIGIFYLSPNQTDTFFGNDFGCIFPRDMRGANIDRGVWPDYSVRNTKSGIGLREVQVIGRSVEIIRGNLTLEAACTSCTKVVKY